MLAQLLGVEDESANRKPTRKTAEQAISAHSEIVTGIFTALADKLPRLRNFIEVGAEILRGLLQEIRKFNHASKREERATAVAVHQPMSFELERIFEFFEYAGVVRKLDTISRGTRGKFQRYALHYSLLIKENALSLGASHSVENVIAAFQKKSRHALVYLREPAIWGTDQRARCTLELPPCQSCGAERVSEEARFCMKCGAPLVDSSVYEELLRAPIDKLSLTRRKIEGIRNQTPIRTVQDILLDEEMRQIRLVKSVGPVWAARIRNAAREFVSV